MRDKNNTITQRYEWLDVAKGIAILLMMVGHTSIPDPINRFIFAFHMPLFFMASGFCTNWTKLSFTDFFLHKCKTLLIPFVVYSIIVLVVGVYTGQMDAKQVLVGGWASNCYPLWFIPILFLSLLLTQIIVTYTNGKVQLMVWFSLAAIASLLKYYKIYLPWTISPMFYASFLLMAGTCSKKITEYIVNPKWWGLVLCFIVTAIISHFWKVNMAWNTINPVVFITIGAFAGTYMIFGVSSIINKFLKKSSNILSWIGKETYVILAFSSIIPSTIDVIYPMNVVFKYLITFLLLYMLILTKRKINKVVGSNIL